MNKIFLDKQRLGTRNTCEGLSMYVYCVLSRAESAIAFSRLHQEAAKEINLVNPVNPVKKY